MSTQDDSEDVMSDEGTEEEETEEEVEYDTDDELDEEEVDDEEEDDEEEDDDEDDPDFEDIANEEKDAKIEELERDLKIAKDRYNDLHKAYVKLEALLKTKVPATAVKK
jgi:hypothetical protein